MKILLFVNFIFTTFLYLVISAPQQGPEINDQFEDSNHTEADIKNVHVESNSLVEAIDDIVVPNTALEITEHVQNPVEVNDTELIAQSTPTAVEPSSFMSKFFMSIKRPIHEFIETPQVSVVLRNIGTCLVNGAMEIVSFYFPAPFIPLIASAAGMIIPFEPVVTLRKRMPVTSYRRAFKTAVNSFMGTFDRFKTSEEDPYMTRRFNRRFMGNSKGYEDKD